MAPKRQRQTFEKMKREQAVRERRERKQERKAAARLAKAEEGTPALDGGVPTEADAPDSDVIHGAVDAKEN